MAATHRGGKWVRVNGKHPCPICKAPDWCSVTTDGALVACRRVEPGCWKSKTDKAGTPYYLHRLNGNARPELPAPRGPLIARADADVLDRAYSGLLERLQLSQRHREALQARGLTDAEIDRRGYRSLPVQGRARMAGELRVELGDSLLSVPGFILKQGAGERPYVTIAGAAGLVLPVREAAGRIAALLVRRDDPGDGRGKYLYLSSAKASGPGPGTPAHVPLGITAPVATCRLTEGALKADVAAALSGLPTIGAAGLAWRPALDALRQLGCQTIRLAFDADAFDNAHVARAVADCREALDAVGLAVELERWDRADGKGIDDLLATGKAPEVLAGEAAQAAIAEIVAAATAGEPAPAPDELARLPEILAAGGAAALFADRPLLEALARLATTDPAGYAAHRATFKGLVSLRDLEAALKPYLREQARDRPPVLMGEAGYCIDNGRICRERGTPDGGTALVPLCNFTARIVGTLTRDDGVEQTALFTAAGTMVDGRELPAVQVPAADFAGLAWVTTAWHGEAVVYAGQGTRDHLRAAIELLSPVRSRRTVYTHTGWREIAGEWHYLHGGGAIRTDGPASSIEVELPGPLGGYSLPAPPTGPELVRAVGASLALLDGLAPDRIAFPLLGAVYRAVLGEAPGAIDLSVYLAGEHGAGKSELAALAQQHFGAGLDARHLPGSWLSTGNALEGLAFAAKDALFVVDDYAPRGAVGDRQRLEREADRLLRAQGNRAGRQRMRADGSLRPERPPRGLILSTGEDVPAGQSLRGRLLVLEISKGDMALERLTPHQRSAAAGLYAQALAGFVRWLAPRYADLRGSLPGQRAALRDRALAESSVGSPRTPGIVADLSLGLSLFLDFACTCGALSPEQRRALEVRAWTALRDAAAAQAEHVKAAEPVAQFLRLLAAAVGSGRAHVAGADGLEPHQPGAWGWYGHEEQESREEVVIRWRHQGRRVGWVQKADLYLEPEASYAAAQEMARDQGEALPVSPRTLHRRLRERGMLTSTEPGREVLTVRRTLEGRRRAVLHLRADVLSPPQPDQPDQSGEHHGENGRDGGRVTGQESLDPASNPTTKPDQNGRENGQLVGLVGSNNGVGAFLPGDGEESINPPGCGDAWEPEATSRSIWDQRAT